MPGGDGTGPVGMGPMTGRAAGYCAGYGVPGFMNPVPGRYGAWGGGFWGGRGRGCGWRNRYWATGLPGWARAGIPAWGGIAYAAAPQPEQELGMLRTQAESLEETLADIRKRIEELDAQTKEE